jgi:hypothetical protein
MILYPLIFELFFTDKKYIVIMVWNSFQPLEFGRFGITDSRSLSYGTCSPMHVSGWLVELNPRQASDFGCYYSDCAQCFEVGYIVGSITSVTSGSDVLLFLSSILICVFLRTIRRDLR